MHMYLKKNNNIYSFIKSTQQHWYTIFNKYQQNKEKSKIIHLLNNIIKIKDHFLYSQI